MTEKELKKLEEFEDIFGNTPFQNIQKIKEYIQNNFVSVDLYNKEKENNKELKKANKKLQSDIEIKDKVINRTCKYINEAKIMNKAIPVYPNKGDTPYTVGVASIEEIKQHFYEEVEKENE